MRQPTSRPPVLATVTALAAAAAALGALAWRPAPASAALERADESPILEHMEAMNAAMRFFQKTSASAENRDTALEWAGKLQAGVVASKGFTPKSAEKVDAAQRPEFVTGYRKLLVEVLAATCRLEMALLEGKYDEANRIAREELAKLKKQGHDRYEDE